MTVYEDFLGEVEENSILDEIQPYLAKLHYEFDHWDDVCKLREVFFDLTDVSFVCTQAIHGYRETERLKWNEKNKLLLQRVRELAFPPTVAQLKHVHVLDLDKNGYIKPHIDATRVCYLKTSRKSICNNVFVSVLR